MQKFYSWLGAVIAACILLASAVSIPNAQAANFVVNTSNAALSGLWFNESEAGWGASLTQQGPIIFAAWYTYDASGLPAWYVMSNCAIVADACTGDIYRVTGGTKPTIAWAGATRAVSKSGSATVTFTDVNTGVFSYMLNGVTASRSITRQVFANGSTPPTMDYTGLWWNANESGWGIAITQQFSTIFATWFTYDDAGTPVWYVASNCAMTANNCNGDLYYVVGGTPPTLAWKGGARTVTKVGTININFTSGTTATLNYTINGISGSRLITPQVFYAALTVSTAPSLAPAEQRVGKLVLSDPRAFANLPITELADRAHVSKPTVVRFCRSVGYDGLTDFKLKLAGSVSEGVPFVHRSVDVDDKTSDVLVKVIDNTVAAFLKYRNDASSFAIQKATDALTAAEAEGNRIEFFGVGNSGIVAQDAQHKFFRLGVNTVAYSDGHMQVMSASMMGPGDCVVVISNSGRTRDLMDACDIARKNGATTIVITASGSPLANLAKDAGHIHLAADHPEGYDRYSPMVSRLLHLMIIDILATCLALRIGGKLQPLLKEMKNNLRNKRYA